MKIRVLLIIICILSIYFTKAQTGVYKTYEDFKSGKLEKMDDEDVKYSENSFGVVLKFTSLSGETIKYKPKELWGFLFKGNLFRTDENDLTFVVDTGKVCFYENGTSHLSMIKSGKNYGVFIRGYFCYMSADLNSKIYRMPFSGNGNFVVGNKKEYKKFMDNYPEHEKLYDCIDRTVDYRKIRLCVTEYIKK